MQRSYKCTSYRSKQKYGVFTYVFYSLWYNHNTSIYNLTQLVRNEQNPSCGGRHMKKSLISLSACNGSDLVCQYLTEPVEKLALPPQ